MSRVFRESGKNGRCAQFCETCGKVAGPLPFGRGEVLLTMTLRGSFCDDCIPRVHVYSAPAASEIARVTARKGKGKKKKKAARVQLALEWIEAL